MDDTLQHIESGHLEKLDQAYHKEPTLFDSQGRLFLQPYAAELAGYFRSFADKLMFYAEGRYECYKFSQCPAHLRTDIKMTKLRLEGLERLCQAWLQEFLSEEDKP